MPRSISPTRLNHINLVLEDYDASVAHFADLYGAELLADYPQKDLNAGLIEIGRVIFELFVPSAWFLNARYGPHYLGIEYQADLEEVRAAVAVHGIRIVRDIGLALHTHPADAFGVSFEFYAGWFHEREWEPLGGPMKSAEWWRDEHPLGLTGLKGCTLAVAEIDAAAVFFKSFLSAEVAYDELRPAIGARAVGLQIADGVIELLTPVGDGALRSHLHAFGEGIRSTVFTVRDIDQARRYFAERGVALAAAAAPGGFAVPAGANLGVMFEFVA